MQVPAAVGCLAHERCKIIAMENAEPLDAIDRRILRALQTDGRMIYDALAAQVSL